MNSYGGNKQTQAMSLEQSWQWITMIPTLGEDSSDKFIQVYGKVNILYTYRYMEYYLYQHVDRDPCKKIGKFTILSTVVYVCYTQ